MDFATIITITIALIFLSTGIVVTKVSKEPSITAVLSFWSGFIFNIIGILSMGAYAEANAIEGVEKSMLVTVHSALGIIGTVAVFILTISATTIMVGKNEERKEKFYGWARFLWLIWLVPFIVGIIMGFMK